MSTVIQTTGDQTYIVAETPDEIASSDGQFITLTDVSNAIQRQIRINVGHIISFGPQGAVDRAPKVQRKSYAP